jgi:uncharacterized protein YyaL (SSP411 family)
MRKITLTLAIALTSLTYLLAQTEGVHIYNPDADAKADITAALKKAKAENKQVLLQIGGNWCPWCIKLHGMETADPQIDSLLKADYVMVLVNIPKEKDKRDPQLMASLDNPQRFGFPVLVVLNQEGKRIHTQDSWYLELDKSYDKEKLMHFLLMWNVTAANTF